MVSTSHPPKPLAAKVGEKMAEYMASIPAKDQIPIPDGGLKFQDFDDDTSDSGLESIL